MPREPVDRQRIEQFLQALGKHCLFQQILPDVETASLRGDPEAFQRKFEAFMEMWRSQHAPGGRHEHENVLARSETGQRGDFLE